MTDYKELIRRLREADHVATSDDTGAFRFDDKLAAEAALFIECLIQVCGEAYRRISDLEHEARKRAEAEVYRAVPPRNGAQSSVRHLPWESAAGRDRPHKRGAG